MLGQRAIYEDGWLGVHPPPAAERMGPLRRRRVEPYNVAVDRSQSTNLAEHEPERLARLVTRWFVLADQYQALPLDDRTALEPTTAERPERRASP